MPVNGAGPYVQGVLQAAGWETQARFLGAAYTFVPFLLACGIAAFPLTAAEALAPAEASVTRCGRTCPELPPDVQAVDLRQ